VKKAAAGLVIGLTGALFALALNSVLNPLETVEWKTYDWRMARTAAPATARKDIVLVEIDEYSLRSVQHLIGRWPWPRVMHSSLIDYLARGGPRTIAYDVNFADSDRTRFEFAGDEWTGAQSDRALADSVRQAGNVIMLADATLEGHDLEARALDDGGYRLGDGILNRPVVFPPYEALAQASAALGHNFFVLDADGPIRHSVPFVRTGDRALPSLGVAAALRAATIGTSAVALEADALRIADRRMPLQWRTVSTSEGPVRYAWSLINFRGPALLPDLKSRPYARYSFYDLFYSEQQILAGEKPQIDPSAFRDTIVFVGVTAAGLHDVFETPFAHGKMPGIQVHAAVADDILSNRFLRPATARARIAIVLLSGVAVGILATLAPAWYAAAGAVVFAAGLTCIATAAFGRGLWIDLAQPALAVALSLFGGVSYQYFIEGREKRQVKRLFGRYVSKDIFDQLVGDPSLAKLGGHRREMTVLFSDIRGFTTFSESGEPEEIVAVLNEYFTRMVDVVFRHKGTLDKFVGDMVMALFGAPLDDPDHADHAVAAALDMVRQLDRLNAEWQRQGRPPLDIGIGINTGPMIAGHIGSEAIMSYTVIGDAVNLGSRLESLNKNYGTRVIISDSTRRRLKGNYVFRPLGDVVVKGKTQAVPIFEVVAHHEAPV
jgi:adenylate cyclase